MFVSTFEWSKLLELTHYTAFMSTNFSVTASLIAAIAEWIPFCDLDKIKNIRGSKSPPSKCIPSAVRVNLKFKGGTFCVADLVFFLL